MSSETTARLLLASALEMNIADIPDDAAINRLKNWDSLAHMRLVLALEKHMGAELSPNNVVNLSCLADIIVILDGGEVNN